MSLTTKQKIKIEMIKKNLSGAEIGRRAGVCRDAISKTIKGEIKSSRLRRAIADAIGVEITDLWPENGRVHPLPPPAGDNPERN